MENEIRKLIPTTWNLSAGSEEIVINGSKEFSDVQNKLKNAGLTTPIKTVKRIQNLYTLGQFLLREQFLLADAEGKKDYYRVQRYKEIMTDLLPNAIKYNLDPRRINETSLTLYSKLSLQQNFARAIIMVQTVTDSPYSDQCRPERNSDYFIEYVVYFV